jgi:hypothetical protein
MNMATIRNGKGRPACDGHGPAATTAAPGSTRAGDNPHGPRPPATRDERDALGGAALELEALLREQAETARPGDRQALLAVANVLRVAGRGLGRARRVGRPRRAVTA